MLISYHHFNISSAITNLPISSVYHKLVHFVSLLQLLHFISYHQLGHFISYNQIVHFIICYQLEHFISYHHLVHFISYNQLFISSVTTILYISSNITNMYISSVTTNLYISSVYHQLVHFISLSPTCSFSSNQWNKNLSFFQQFPDFQCPPLPGKTIVKNMNKDFLEKRKKSLNTYLMVIFCLICHY